MSKIAVPYAASFLLDRPLKLYRDMLRLADYLSFENGHSREAMRNQVRKVWKRNKDLKDEDEITKAREDAVRALSNSFAHFAMVEKGALRGANNVSAADDDEEIDGEHK